jgi:ABC-type Fe3+ transport system permease subunit
MSPGAATLAIGLLLGGPLLVLGRWALRSDAPAIPTGTRPADRDRRRRATRRGGWACVSAAVLVVGTAAGAFLSEVFGR